MSRSLTSSDSGPNEKEITDPGPTVNGDFLLLVEQTKAYMRAIDRKEDHNITPRRPPPPPPLSYTSDEESVLSMASLEGMEDTEEGTITKEKIKMSDGSTKVIETKIDVKIKNGKKYRVKTVTTMIEKRVKRVPTAPVMSSDGSFNREDFLQSVSQPRGGSVSYTDPWTSNRIDLPQDPPSKKRGWTHHGCSFS